MLPLWRVPTNPIPQFINSRCTSLLKPPGYSLLKHSVRNEIGVELKVNAIDKLLANPDKTDIERVRALQAERESLMPGRGPILDYTKGARWQSVANNPVMDGEICCLPYPGREDLNDKNHRPLPIKIKYVKLAYFSDCSSIQTNDLVKNYFCERLSDQKRYPFPQDETANQNFNARQLDAYMTLGDCIAKQQLLRKNSTDNEVNRALVCSEGELAARQNLN